MIKDRCVASMKDGRLCLKPAKAFVITVIEGGGEIREPLCLKHTLERVKYNLTALKGEIKRTVIKERVPKSYYKD